MCQQKWISCLGLVGLFVWLMPAASSASARPQQTATDQDTNQQLLEAVEKGDKAAVEGLLAQGADPNAKNHFGSSALQVAAWNA